MNVGFFRSVSEDHVDTSHVTDASNATDVSHATDTSHTMDSTDPDIGQKPVDNDANGES